MNVFNTEKLPIPLIVLIAIFGIIEIASQVSEFGLLSTLNLRQLFLMLGAFWPPLITNDLMGIYGSQKYIMFITYAFIHGNFLHFLLNSAVLLSLGKMISYKLGNLITVLLFFTSSISGGLVFYFLSKSASPMIGASGAVFGFIGVWQYYDLSSRLSRKEPLQHFFFTIGALIIGNILIAFVLEGGLAWEAHLGGFLIGFIFVPFLSFCKEIALNN